MPDVTEVSCSIYERLVEGEGDILGQMAYSIYKRRKREFIEDKKRKLGRDILSLEDLREFTTAQTDYTLAIYKTYAEQLSQERKKIELEYRQKYEEFIDKLQPQSCWYDVLQSFIASFLFVFAGYVLLKITESWERLLSYFIK